MGVPKTPKDFDYDLWTTERGEYMVRVKATGEICEVSCETMRFLRTEEKQMRRAMNKSSQSVKQIVKGPILSLDNLKQENGNSLFPVSQEDQSDLERIVMANILVERFLAELTPSQLEITVRTSTTGWPCRNGICLSGTSNISGTAILSKKVSAAVLRLLSYRRLRWKINVKKRPHTKRSVLDVRSTV